VEVAGWVAVALRVGEETAEGEGEEGKAVALALLLQAAPIKRVNDTKIKPSEKKRFITASRLDIE
jgi:hypothetical protein